MKTIYFLFALALPLMVLAQAPQPKEALTKKQRLELHVKEMQLALDLSENQMASVRTLLEKYQAKGPKRGEKTAQLSSDERYEMRMQRMDTQLALQKEMKSILNDAQYAQWKERMPRKRMAERSHHKPKGMHRNEGSSPSPRRKRN
jgi:hypothetical protein